MRLTGKRPRVAFLGLGWIGRHRMQAIAATGAVEIVVLADPSEEAVAAAAEHAPDAVRGADIEAVLAAAPDGVVIATPSALHAAQALAALEAGAAVFCQKPLGRDAAETAAVVAAARRADRLLSVDLSYRETAAARALKREVEEGGLGRLFALDLTFHNAYGPDKAWFYDRALAGGGCLMDLGVHLVDLALWLTDFPEVRVETARLLREGAPLAPEQGVEDYAVATLDLAGAVARVACSWRLQAGQEAVIGAALYGTEGGAEMRNLGGSFYDFEAARHRGTAREVLVSPPDDWGGRAAAAWAQRLAAGAGFDPEAERLTEVARVLDAIYAAA